MMELQIPNFRVFNSGDTEEIHALMRSLKERKINFIIHVFTFMAFDRFRKVQYPLERVKITYGSMFANLGKEKESENVDES